MKLTVAQYEKLAWLHKQGGSGYLDKNGRVVAGGEHMPQGCWPAWLNLIAHGLIAGGDGRLAVTDYGRRHVTPNAKLTGEGKRSLTESSPQSGRG